MVLIQLLLPLPTAASAGSGAALEATRSELTAQFNGLTAYLRSPAKGWWTGPDGLTEEDDVIMVEVVTEIFAREWWEAYTAMLAQRFGQETIHVRAMPVEMLGERN